MLIRRSGTTGGRKAGMSVSEATKLGWIWRKTSWLFFGLGLLQGLGWRVNFCPYIYFDLFEWVWSKAVGANFKGSRLPQRVFYQWFF